MSESKYQEHADYLEQLGKNQEQAASDAWEIEHFLRRHESDGMILCDANRSIIYQYFHGGDISEAALEDAWANNHPVFRNLARRASEAEVRAQLVKEIYGLAAGSPQAKKLIVDSLKWKTTEEVIAKRDELKRLAELRHLPKEELREIARTPLQAQFKPIEPLYQSREMILSASPAEIRRLIRVSGLDAVNAVLSKRSKD
jgi:hypothetical protein